MIHRGNGNPNSAEGVEGLREENREIWVAQPAQVRFFAKLVFFLIIAETSTGWEQVQDG